MPFPQFSVEKKILIIFLCNSSRDYINLKKICEKINSIFIEKVGFYSQLHFLSENLFFKTNIELFNGTLY